MNLAREQFFRYSMQNEADTGYNQKLVGLVTVPEGEIFSHWVAGDHIVFCPSHLKPYVAYNYGEISLG